MYAIEFNNSSKIFNFHDPSQNFLSAIISNFEFLSCSRIHEYLKVISINAAVAFNLITNAAGVWSLFDVIINLNRENQFDRVEKYWSCLHCGDDGDDSSILLSGFYNVSIEEVSLWVNICKFRVQNSDGFITW